MHPFRTAILTGVFLTLSSLTQAATLEERVAFFQQRIEARFRPLGSVVNLALDAPGGKVTDHTGLADASLWTSVYMAGQCFRARDARTGSERDEATRLVHDLLALIERRFEVTGIPGLPARFAYDSRDPSLSQFAFPTYTDPAKADEWWYATGSWDGWIWNGHVSRDTMTGVFFGLGVCHDLLPDDAEVRRITEHRIVDTVLALERNGWKIPTGPQKPEFPKPPTWTVDSLGRLSWLEMASRVSGDPALSKLYDRHFKNRKDQLIRAIEPTGINNLTEYYAWNLRYLRYYTLLTGERDPKRLKYYRKLFGKKLWQHTRDHLNTQFTFFKLALINGGGTGPVDVSHLPKEDRKPYEQAITSLNELAARDRSDHVVINSTRPDIGRMKTITLLKKFVKLIGMEKYLEFVRKIEPNQADRPLPIKDQVEQDYMWQRSPFEPLDGGSGGLNEYPAVDLIFAYWMGRHFQLL